MFNVVLGLHFKQKKTEETSEPMEVEVTDLSRFVCCGDSLRDYTEMVPRSDCQFVMELQILIGGRS